MTHQYDYKSLRDAFTLAASPVVVDSAFDTVRDSLRNNHTVKITMGEGKDSLLFMTLNEFEVWVAGLNNKSV